ncbi:hypothetical protein JP74_10275 [Devosia sp. 17-2-E-8]|nr:hypothetical protein JP74_10275 [Devosia sp. 17-2-E-8]
MSDSFLGIDIGGTASRWVLVGQDGSVLARGAAGGATGHTFNPVEREKLANVIGSIRAAAQVTPRAITIGATGLGPRAYDDVREIMAAAFGTPGAAMITMDDMELAYRAVFAPGTGHLIAAGTGSVGLHLLADGNTIRVGGRGLLIDDGGSGTWIALRALDLIYRRIDDTGGPAEAAILARVLFDTMGGDTWDDTRAFVYGGDRGRIGQLAQQVAAAAVAGDPLALQILSDAGVELARLGSALIKRTRSLPIGYVGGIVRLHPVIKTSLLAALQGEDVSFPETDAALHAAGMARTHHLTTD